MPTIVSFGIGTKDVAPLTFTVANVADVSIAYTLLGFNGTWNRTAQAYLLSGRTNVLSGPNLFGDFVVQTIEPLTWAGDNAAAGAAGLETACSPRPGATTGSRRIALANPDGQLNPGDGLVVIYTNCWIDDPTDDIDLLLDGTITMSGYIENASPFSTGFDEIHFVSLTIRETETAGGLVNIDPDPIVVTGKLGLFVTP